LGSGVLDLSFGSYMTENETRRIIILGYNDHSWPQAQRADRVGNKTLMYITALNKTTSPSSLSK
jgi:hypothetical protein